MTTPLLVATLLLAQVGLERTGVEGKMGLSDRQILALGQQGFVNKFSEKFGSSTAAMVDAFEIYGGAVKRLNDQVFLRKSPETLKVVGSLRVRLGRFRNEMCDVGRALSGGGTMWNITYSETRADVEETLAIKSGVIKKTPPKRVVSEVTRAMDALAAAARERRDDVESMKESGGGMAEIESSFKIARAEFAEIVKLAAKLPRKESDAMLEFCLAAIRIANGQLYEGAEG
jgi:hypothetical protein